MRFSASVRLPSWMKVMSAARGGGIWGSERAPGSVSCSLGRAGCVQRAPRAAAPTFEEEGDEGDDGGAQLGDGQAIDPVVPRRVLGTERELSGVGVSRGGGSGALVLGTAPNLGKGSAPRSAPCPNPVPPPQLCTKCPRSPASSPALRAACGSCGAASVRRGGVRMAPCIPPTTPEAPLKSRGTSEPPIPVPLSGLQACSRGARSPFPPRCTDLGSNHGCTGGSCPSSPPNLLGSARIPAAQPPQSLF